MMADNCAENRDEKRIFVQECVKTGVGLKSGGKAIRICNLRHRQSAQIRALGLGSGVFCATF